MFVQGTLPGRMVQAAVRLPPSAVLPGDYVHVIDADNRLARRDVRVLRRSADAVIVSGGLHPGERVITTRLRMVSEGMRLEPAAQEQGPLTVVRSLGTE
jgi:multidrug efflux pump subunit AcrA (membrane-fusion protein)